MTNLEAVLIIECGTEDTTEEEVLAAWQHIYDSGAYSHLQGFYQRGVINLIEAGVLTRKGE